jgi:hypothetical protein
MWLETVVVGGLIQVSVCQIFLRTQEMPFQRVYFNIFQGACPGPLEFT